MSYSRDYPALRALQSAAPDHGVPAIQAGDPLNYDHVICAESQCSFRKCLRERDLATRDEVKTAALRCDQLKSEFAVGSTAEVLHAIRTLHQDTRVLCNALHQNQIALLQIVTTVRSDVQKLEARQCYQDAITYNSRFVRVAGTSIQRVPHKVTGAFPTAPVWFPDTLGTLADASDANINDLFAFYELPNDNHNQHEKKMAIYRYLGIQC